MSSFQLTIETSRSSTFSGDPAPELDFVLRKLARFIRDGGLQPNAVIPLVDSVGLEVGVARLQETQVQTVTGQAKNRSNS